MTEKIAIITVQLVPEAAEANNEELEKEILESMEGIGDGRFVAWCRKVEKVKVLPDA